MTLNLPVFHSTRGNPAYNDSKTGCLGLTRTLGLSSSGTENLHKACDLPLAPDNQFVSKPLVREKGVLRRIVENLHDVFRVHRVSAARALDRTEDLAHRIQIAGDWPTTERGGARHVQDEASEGRITWCLFC
jgi:hypothetical protein